LPTNLEELTKLTPEELAGFEDEYDPEDLEAWHVANFLDNYVVFLDYYPEDVKRKLNGSLLLILLKYKMQLDLLKEVKL